MGIKEVRIERIKQKMNEHGLTNRELAKRTGISESGISRILSGEIDPRIRTFAKMAQALKTDETWLMGYDVDYVADLDGAKVILERLNPTNQAKLLAYYQGLLDSQEDNKA